MKLYIIGNGFDRAHDLKTSYGVYMIFKNNDEDREHRIVTMDVEQQ